MDFWGLIKKFFGIMKDEAENSVKKELKDLVISRAKWLSFKNALKECDHVEEWAKNSLLDWFYNESAKSDGNVIRYFKKVSDNDAQEAEKALFKDAIDKTKPKPGEETNAVTQCVKQFLAIAKDYFPDDNNDIRARAVTRAIKAELDSIRSAQKSLRKDINYRGSFAEELNNGSYTPKGNKSPFHFTYRHAELPCLGRENAREELDAFMRAEDDFLFWSVTGCGGSGKSKLAYQLFTDYHAQGWHCIWLNRQRAERLARVSEHAQPATGYPFPLLFICDYAALYLDDLRKLLHFLKDFRRTQPVRVLLLERAGYGRDGVSMAQTWYDTLMSGETNDLEQNEYLPAPIDLNDRKIPDKSYLEILQNYVAQRRKEDPELPELSGDLQKMLDYAKERLGDVSARAENRTPAVRCLFLLFVADAALSGNPYQGWKAKELLGQYLDRTRHQWGEHFENALPSAERLLIFATATNSTLDISKSSSLPEIIRGDANGIKGKYRTASARREILGLLCDRSEQTNAITPLEPDLVGEHYVLSQFGEYFEDETEEWANAVTDARYFPGFCDFFARCAADWFTPLGHEHLDALLAPILPTLSDIAEFLLARSLFSITYLSDKLETRLFAVQKLAVLYNEHRTDVIAYALVKAAVDITDADETRETAEKIGVLLKSHNTPEIAEACAKALFNATVKMTDAKEMLDTAEKIHALLKSHDTPEIAENYAMALANATYIMTDAKERLETAEKIHALLKSHDTPEIAEACAKALFNATVYTTDANKVLKTAKIIEDLLSKHNTPRIAVWCSAEKLLAIYFLDTADARRAEADAIRETLAQFPTLAEKLKKIDSMLDRAVEENDPKKRFSLTSDIFDILKS